MKRPDSVGQSDSNQLLCMLSCVERWGSDSISKKVGTLKLRLCVMLKPMSEHLVWGRLPPRSVQSVGSTMVIEPRTSRCVHRIIRK